MTSSESATGGGCSRKIGPAELARALSSLEERLARIPAGDVEQRVDLVDACELTVRPSVRSFVTSTDLLYAVSRDAYTCGYVAAVHALSDIFAVLGQPLWASAAIGLSNQDLQRDALSAILSGVSDALFANGVVFAGGHSVYAADLFVSIAVSGIALNSNGRTKPEPGDLLVLTKPLGSGIALTALRMGLVDESALIEEYDCLRQSNRAASSLLLHIKSVEHAAVRAVTDVSGFGFLSAVALVGGGQTAVISGASVPQFSRCERLMSSGAISPLTDTNMIQSDQYTLYSGMPEPRVAALRVLLNDPQTSGGLLAALSPEGARMYLDDTSQSSLRPSVVGRFADVAQIGASHAKVIVDSASLDVESDI